MSFQKQSTSGSVIALSQNSEAIKRCVAELQHGVNTEENFRHLFDSYYQAVFRFFEKRGFSLDQCHDLTQETFISVYKGIASFRGDAAFQTWLFLIAANVWRNTLRHQSTLKRAAEQISLDETRDDAEDVSKLDVADTSMSTPLEGILQDERERMLRAAMAALPEQMRKCVILRVHQELSYQDIAIVLRLSVETVRTHLKQARKQLKAKLAHYFDEAEVRLIEE